MKTIVNKNKNIIIGIAIIIIVMMIGVIGFFKSSKDRPELVDDYKQDINLDDYDMVGINKAIKKIDSNFNMNYYKLLVERDADDKEIMTFTYFINSRIETNKVFLVTLNDKKVESVALKDQNLEKIKDENKKLNTDLMQKLTDFEKKDKEDFIANNLAEYLKNDEEVLKKMSINPQVFTDAVTKYEDKYYYDFNTQELTYMVTLFNDEGVIKKIEVTLAN